MPDKKNTPQTGGLLTRSRLIIIGMVAVLLIAVAISLFTNLSNQGRMGDRWDASGRVAQASQQAAQPTKFQLEPLEILSGDRRHRFMVEVMRNDTDRARGLMFRQAMPQDNGMLFDFGQDQMVSMWMKNTFISLDMVFILADGRIHRIEARTEPESERTVSSGVPVRGVLELNANVASRLNLKPGDRILHPMFK